MPSVPAVDLNFVLGQRGQWPLHRKYRSAQSLRSQNWGASEDRVCVKESRRGSFPLLSRKVAVTLPEFSFCFSKNVLTQSCSLSLGEMVPDIFVCWPGGGGPPPPPFQLHPSAPRGQPFENTVNISVFSSSSPQQ